MKLETVNKEHNLRDFSCGIDTIDEYLKTRALIDGERLLSKTYVILDENKIAAFFTLILHSLKDSEKEFFIDKNINQRVPALLIGQLAVDKKYQRRRIGVSMLKHAVMYALGISRYVNFPVIIVDAYNENLVPYYEKNGFKRFKDNGLRLFIPMAEVIKTINKF